MRIGARIMLFLSIINFIQLMINGSFNGGKSYVIESTQSTVLQILLIIFLVYMSFGKIKVKDKK
jgi:hypothetical protein